MTDFVDNINGYKLGGNAINGEWQAKYVYVADNVGLSQNNTNTYTLDLPNDGYDYEITGWIAIDTALTTGVRAIAALTNGNGDFLQKVSTDYTRRNYNTEGCGTYRMLIPANTRQLKVKAEEGNITGMYLFWSWYRRVGLND